MIHVCMIDKVDQELAKLSEVANWWKIKETINFTEEDMAGI